MRQLLYLVALAAFVAALVSVSAPMQITAGVLFLALAVVDRPTTPLIPIWGAALLLTGLLSP